MVPLCHQETVSGNAKCGVMMQTSPASAFVMAQSEFLL